MSKPDWKDAPEWANYLAQDEEGDWFFYENEPYHNHNFWNADNGLIEEAKGKSENWKETLEERPK